MGNMSKLVNAFESRINMNTLKYNPVLCERILQEEAHNVIKGKSLTAHKKRHKLKARFRARYIELFGHIDFPEKKVGLV